MLSETGFSGFVNIVIPVYGTKEPVDEVINQIPLNKIHQITKKIKILVIYTPVEEQELKLNLSQELEKITQIIIEKRRGYGRAYLTGFKNVKDGIIITFDADGTYPVEKIPEILEKLITENIDFINVNRLDIYEKNSFTKTNYIGNKILTFLTNLLFRTKLKDSQSGMWIFKTDLLRRLELNSTGMEFSTEIKIKSWKIAKNFAEISLPYYKRIDGSVPVLNPLKDGSRIFLFLLNTRIRFFYKKNN